MSPWYVYVRQMNCNLPRVKIHSSTASKSSLNWRRRQRATGVTKMSKFEIWLTGIDYTTRIRGSKSAFAQSCESLFQSQVVSLISKIKWFLKQWFMFRYNFKWEGFFSLTLSFLFFVDVVFIVLLNIYINYYKYAYSSILYINVENM